MISKIELKTKYKQKKDLVMQDFFQSADEIFFDLIL